MRRVFPLLLLLALLLAGCQGEAAPAVRDDLDHVPAYAGEPYVVINDNQPFFGEEEYTTEAFETYSALDGLGRCGTAYACVLTHIIQVAKHVTRYLSCTFKNSFRYMIIFQCVA